MLDPMLGPMLDPMLDPTLDPTLDPMLDPTDHRKLQFDEQGIHFDKPFDKDVWMARLGQTIGAVLSITQANRSLQVSHSQFPHVSHPTGRTPRVTPHM